MPRNPITKKSKLFEIINKLLNSSLKFGYITISDMEKMFGLSDRMLREYIHDLVSIGFLRYIGNGRYVINYSLVNDILSDDFHPEFIIDYEDLLFHYFQEGMSNRVYEEIEKVLKPSVEINARELRKKILDFRVPDNPFLLEDKLIHPPPDTLFLDDIYLAGSASKYIYSTYLLEDIILLSVAIVASSINLAYYKDNAYIEGKSTTFSVPQIHKMEQKILDSSPFYELTTNYPELMELGRRFLTRLLADRLNYRLNYEFLKTYADRINVFFKWGSLIPHGFIISGRRLLDIIKEISAFFRDTISFASSRGIILSGISYGTHDNVFVRNVSELLNIKLYWVTNDTNFLYAILRDGESTCIIRRSRERGKPLIENWYEFYMRLRDAIIKVEFISDNPIEDANYLRGIIWSSYIIFPNTKGRVAGPATLYYAKEKAESRVMEIKRLVDIGLRTAFAKIKIDYIFEG